MLIAFIQGDNIRVWFTQDGGTFSQVRVSFYAFLPKDLKLWIVRNDFLVSELRDAGNGFPDRS